MKLATKNFIEAGKIIDLKINISKANGFPLDGISCPHYDRKNRVLFFKNEAEFEGVNCIFINEANVPLIGFIPIHKPYYQVLGDRHQDMLKLLNVLIDENV